MQFNEAWARIAWGLQGFDPRKNPVQAEVVYSLLEGTRYLLICGGERAGKSFLTVALDLLLMQPGNWDEPDKSEKKLGWIIGPDYNQARAEFQYIYDALSKGEGFLKQVSMPNNPTSPWTLETSWNFELSTKTSNDLSKIASYAPDFVDVVEAAQQPYEVMLKARGRVMESRGHVILSGTLEPREGRSALPWYGDTLKRWKNPNTDGARSFSIPTWSNLAKFPGGWNDPAIQDEYRFHRERDSLDYFWERYGAEPRKSTGLVIPEFDYTEHVRILEANPDIPVELWIDPGKNAYVVLFVQTVDTVTYVLDRVYRRNAIAHDVIPEAMSNPLWELVKKNQGSHGVIDIAGKHQYGLPSHVEVWQEEADVVLRSNYVHQDVGRDVVRYRLRKDLKLDQPLLLFNANMTNSKSPDGTAGDVLAEFELWKWRQPKPGSSEPLRPVDANNHAIKALGYGLYDKFGPVEERRPRVSRQTMSYWGTY